MQGRDADRQAFEELYERHFHRVYEFVRRRVGDRTEAEDLTQETFFAVFRSLDGFQGRSELEAWIFGVARNVVHAHVRKRARQHRRAFDEESETPPPTPEEQLAASRLWQLVSRQIERMEGWPATALQLRVLERASQREIARRTELSRHAVHRGLEELRRLLAISQEG